jgi:hypothetical protein
MGAAAERAGGKVTSHGDDFQFLDAGNIRHPVAN